jgi:hypothetical protein
MLRTCSLIVATYVLVLSLNVTKAEEVSLADYKCAEFLRDIMHPSDGQKLLKSLMMLSWATGYAASYQKEHPRADVAGIRLMAAVLADACKRAPDDGVVKVITSKIDGLFGNK